MVETVRVRIVQESEVKILWQMLAFHDPKLWQHLDEVGKCAYVDRKGHEGGFRDIAGRRKDGFGRGSVSSFCYSLGVDVLCTHLSR